MWNEIVNEKNIKSFMETFGYFHDSCVKELKYISGAFVDLNLSMRAFNNINTLRMIIQRQYKNPTAIEMEFSELKKLNLRPDDMHNDCIIDGASLFIKDDCIYWADCDGVDDIENYIGTWICAEKLRWREVDKYIGEDEVYCERQN